ncbi:uncharacterized protein LOC124140319 isoform X2 [Haliotis rufescens]|uniref:uncharacterized protein LOC124140319 isoform X2 n=1 Tax=Haliotis rufescens TaxID=6454 RepID=UPI001EAFF2DE|nr:uncharacterized protein LOC124140319 isoform X2 [Haliotis rufescens]
MAKNGHNIAHGVISGIVLVSGIILCVVISVGIHKVEKLIEKQPYGNDGIEIPENDRDSSMEDWHEPQAMPSRLPERHEHHHHRHHHGHHGITMIWAVGFAFILPGLIGCISAFMKKKGVYITHMVFSIITLLVMGIAFVAGILVLASLAVSHPSQCTPVGEMCQCTRDEMYAPVTLNISCDNIHSLYAMAVVVVLVVVSAWILTLVSTILSGVLICRREPTGSVVIQKNPMATTVVHSGVLGFGNGEKKGLPQTHDAAKLVTNMEI